MHVNSNYFTMSKVEDLNFRGNNFRIEDVREKEQKFVTYEHFFLAKDAVAKWYIKNYIKAR